MLMSVATGDAYVITVVIVSGKSVFFIVSAGGRMPVRVFVIAPCI